MRVSKIFFIGSIIAFIASLCLPGYHSDGNSGEPGLLLFAIGWAGLGYGVFTWFGNPALLAAWWFLYSKPHRAVVLSIVAILCMLEFLLHDEMPALGMNGVTISITIVDRGSAYMAWLFSAALMFLASVCLLDEKKPRPVDIYGTLTKK